MWHGAKMSLKPNLGEWKNTDKNAVFLETFYSTLNRIPPPKILFQLKSKYEILAQNDYAFLRYASPKDSLSTNKT